MERRVAAVYESKGWDVTRVAGSHSPKDLVCLKAGFQPEYVQVKGTARGPFADFPPAARRALVERAERAGAVPMLVWRTPKHALRYLPASTWPALPKED